MVLCPYFGLCGGCSLQDVDYEVQLEEKRRTVCRTTGFEEPLVFHDQPFGFRNRMDFIFNPGGLGFREKGRWDRLVDVESCPVSSGGVNDALFELRSFFNENDSFDVVGKRGSLKYAVVREGEGEVSACMVLNRDSPGYERAFGLVQEFAGSTDIGNVLAARVGAVVDESVSSDYEVLKGGDFLSARLGGRRFFYNTQGFFQNNTRVASMMADYVTGLVGESGLDGMLLDLYGGVGIFGVSAAGLFEEAVVVENSPFAKEAFQKNLDENGVGNVRFIYEDACRVKRVLDCPPDAVVTDPPRAGMNPRTIRYLRNCGAKRIIYVSCNLDRLESELAYFRKYRVENAALFDMFPQTRHVEAVVELAKK